MSNVVDHVMVSLYRAVWEMWSITPTDILQFGVVTRGIFFVRLPLVIARADESFVSAGGTPAVFSDGDPPGPGGGPRHERRPLRATKRGRWSCARIS